MRSHIQLMIQQVPLPSDLYLSLRVQLSSGVLSPEGLILEGLHDAFFHVSEEEALASRWEVTKSGTLICAFEVVLGLLVFPASLLFGSLWDMTASSLNPNASPLGRAESVPCFFSYM